MLEPPKKRRRWPWTLGAALLLLICGPIAWRFRPLTSAEHAIVGDWIEHLPRQQTHHHFNADRTFRTENQEVGSWSASSTTISLRFQRRFDDYAFLNFPNQVYAYLSSQLSHSSAYEWDGPDQFRIGPKWDGPDRFRIGPKLFVRVKVIEAGRRRTDGNDAR